MTLPKRYSRYIHARKPISVGFRLPPSSERFRPMCGVHRWDNTNLSSDAETVTCPTCLDALAQATSDALNAPPCRHCQAPSPLRGGRCPHCGFWNVWQHHAKHVTQGD